MKRLFEALSNMEIEELSPRRPASPSSPSNSAQPEFPGGVPPFAPLWDGAQATIFSSADALSVSGVPEFPLPPTQTPEENETPHVSPDAFTLFLFEDVPSAPLDQPLEWPAFQSDGHAGQPDFQPAKQSEPVIESASREDSPSDMASLIRAMRAEMDQMAIDRMVAGIASAELPDPCAHVSKDAETLSQAPTTSGANTSDSWSGHSGAITTMEPEFLMTTITQLDHEVCQAAAPLPEQNLEIEEEPVSRWHLPADIFPSGLSSLVLVLEPELNRVRTEDSAQDASCAESETGTAAVELDSKPLAPPTVSEHSTAQASVAHLPVDALLAETNANEAVPQEVIPQLEKVPAAIPEASITSSGATEKSLLFQSKTVRPARSTYHRVTLKLSPESRLVAMSDADGLGAEKFRVLVARLEHQHKQCDLKSFQVTSCVISEGKTLISGNVAVTLAKHLSANTLLVEGDLHRPTLASMMGLEKLRGISHWWESRDEDLSNYVYRIDGLPLWFLPAGRPCDHPSDLLRSARFVKAFEKLNREFEWSVVDSTPMVPIVDVNLWSRIVDGTLLVVREGVTPVKALKKGLQALDHPNVIGMVLNDATESTDSKYDGQYYGSSKR